MWEGGVESSWTRDALISSLRSHLFNSPEYLDPDLDTTIRVALPGQSSIVGISQQCPQLRVSRRVPTAIVIRSSTWRIPYCMESNANPQSRGSSILHKPNAKLHTISTSSQFARNRSLGKAFQPHFCFFLYFLFACHSERPHAIDNRWNEVWAKNQIGNSRTSMPM